MPVENVTPNRGYPLPYADNDLANDVMRLIDALAAVDLDMAGVLAALLTKSDIGHGHALADVVGLVSGLAAKQELAEKGLANGYAALGSDGKVPASQLPAALFGAMNYQTAWNAATNSPAIPAANIGNKGWYYMVSVAGTTTVGGFNDWQVGDWLVSDGVKWTKIDNTDAVASVAGLRGAITAAALKAALALKAAAYLDVGTAANTVAAGNDDRIVGAMQRGGDEMAGPLLLAADPEDELEATTKRYADSRGAPDAILEDQKAMGTAGGTFTSGAWRARDLNTIVRDPNSLITLDANSRFIPAVSGWVEWMTMVGVVQNNTTRLQNMTDDTTAGYGMSGRKVDDATAVPCSGGCAVEAGKSYQLQHYCSQSKTTDGFGIPGTYGTEIYTRIKFWRNGQ